MSAIRLLKPEYQEELQHLHEQLVAEGILQKEIIGSVEEYLVKIGIYDVMKIRESDFRNYKTELKNSKSYTLKQVCERVTPLRNLHAYWVEKEYGELIKEVNDCDTADKRLVWNVKMFLIQQGIHHIKDIDYKIREKYETELVEINRNKNALSYLKTLDRIKQYSIRQEMSSFAGQQKNKLRYEKQILFLPYLPDQTLAMEFDKVRDKNELVWDFSQTAPENLKKQVFQLLMYILDNMRDDPKERRVRFLLPLQWLYNFCIDEKIKDIERLELDEIQRFEQIVAGKVVNYKNSMQIVDNCRKILFICGKNIHWHANVWYMERFHLAPERVNPSNPVVRLTFYEVTNLRNREILQEYAKYQVGITGLTIGNIRSQQGYVKKFLEYFREEYSICKVGTEQIDQYFKQLQDGDIKADTVNRQISDILKFYQYLKVKEYIKEIPFDPEYYFQKTYPVHHDRSVEEEVYMEILNKIHLFPEVPRLIFLHLWGTGLRVSEVCTLKGNAYYWDGEDAWIKVYQIKMQADKMIPIPLVLYKIMKDYIKRERIKPNDYIFSGQDEGAYRVGSFVKTFKEHCEKNQIANCEYAFKSHDYRHTLATRFYDDGVSMQTIRDYLGHVTENMTKQYVDFMPKKIAKANDEYFKKPGNSLASVITAKKRGDKNEK